MMIDPAHLAQLPFFSAFSTVALRAVAERAVERRFVAGQVIFTAGSASRGLFVVVSGRVRVLRASGGRQHVVHAEGAGGTLGDVPMFEGGGYPATAIAAAETRCIVVTRDGLAAALTADRDVAWILLARLASRVRLLVARLDGLAAHDVTSRLAAYLVARHDSGRETGRRVGEITLGATQAEVAEELGTVRELVGRGLKKLRQSGAIRNVRRGRYEIVDLAALRKAAER